MRPAKFILIDTGSESNQIMMSDVGKMENGIQCSKTYETGSRLLDVLIRFHFSYAITQRIDLPGKSIWNKYCVLTKLTKDESCDYYIIIVNNAIHRLSTRHLNELQSRKNIHIFSLLLDPFDHLPKNIQKQIKRVEWEEVFSFQRSDCERYGFKYTDRIYSRVDISEYAVSTDPKIDVYFIGLAKDRLHRISEIYESLIMQGYICDFTVIADKMKIPAYKKQYPGIRFESKRMPYKTVLRKIASTKCILEYCSEEQDGLTMRFYEAVFYNKLLITNNRTAINSDLFNELYMVIIEDGRETEISRLMQMQKVNYGYMNDFSPACFVKGLIKQS